MTKNGAPTNTRINNRIHLPRLSIPNHWELHITENDEISAKNNTFNSIRLEFVKKVSM